MMRRLLFLLFAMAAWAGAGAQIGEHRTDLAVGVNGGYSLSNIRFLPKITQNYHTGITGGLTIRYTCEKYFNSICAIQAEVNINQMGWNEKILDADKNPVMHDDTEQERYDRTLTYLQVPIFARMGWGREKKGLQFFIQAGPQIGFFRTDKVDTNFNYNNMNPYRANPVIQQYDMEVENKFDFGIAAGGGVEYSVPKLGHLLLDARYYYGLGNIYHDSKRDFFATSNFGNIVIKLTYLFDIINTKN
jgi:hypothetical protein